MKLKYGYKIIITEKLGRLISNYFIDNHHDILKTFWYEKERSNENEERFRILNAVAVIIRDDIQSSVFDSTNCLPPSRMFGDINSDIPESLTYFLGKIILKNNDLN